MRLVELAFESGPSAGIVSCHHPGADHTPDDPFPEGSPCSEPEGVLNGLATLTHETGQRAEAGRQKRFQLLAQSASQHGGLTAGADGDDDRGSIYDRGEDEGRQFRVVDYIDGDPASARASRYLGVDFAIARSSDDDVGIVEVRIDKLDADVLELALIGPLTQFVEQFRGDDRDACAAPEQQLHFPRRDVSAPNNYRWPGLQLQKDGQVIHGGSRDA